MHNEYKYKFRKSDDSKFLCPAREGDTDKTWLFCHHKRANGDGVCGVNFIRTLKDREHQAQHNCDGDPTQRLITRTFRSIFKKCKYCDGTDIPCIRSATIDEIKQYQEKMNQLNAVPNSYGGYKVRGAKQTISQLRRSKTPSPRKRGGRGGRGTGRGRNKSKLNTKRNGRRGRIKVKRENARKTLQSLSPQSNIRLNGKNNRDQRAKSVGIEGILPVLAINDDETTKSGDDSDDNSAKEKILKPIWGVDDDDVTTVSDINIDNKPLQRRSRKRKRAELDGDDDDDGINDDYSDDSFSIHQETKRQKLDRSELKKLELDELLAKALMFKDNLSWDTNDEWCRYCGARGSVSFLHSPWGPKKLCAKHGRLYQRNELNLNNINEPKDIDAVINKTECTERVYLINLIMKHHNLQINNPSLSSYHGIDGKRRSLRNIKKEKINNNNNTNRYIFDSDNDTESSSDDDDDDDEDDEDEEDDDEATFGETTNDSQDDQIVINQINDNKENGENMHNKHNEYNEHNGNKENVNNDNNDNINDNEKEQNGHSMNMEDEVSSMDTKDMDIDKNNDNDNNVNNNTIESIQKQQYDQPQELEHNSEDEDDDILGVD